MALHTTAFCFTVKALASDGLPETKESHLVVCFGEMVIDFVTTTSGLSLAEASAFKKDPGGAPANVAVGITCLGGSSAFIGKSEMMADDEQLEKADRERIFKRFDLNGDGKISATELADCLKALGSVSEDEVKNMMSEIDTDGDGSISYEEFTVFAVANRGLIKDVAKVF